MTERERLIALIKRSSHYISEQDELIEKISDYLLANGVVCPPCKVGDTVYVADYTRLGYMVFECTIEEISHYTYGTFYYLNWGLHIPRFKACKEDSFGKTVFLSKEEAEKALAEQRKEDEGK